MAKDSPAGGRSPCPGPFGARAFLGEAEETPAAGRRGLRKVGVCTRSLGDVLHGRSAIWHFRLRR